MQKPLKILFIKPYAFTPNQAIDVPLGILYLASYLRKYLADSVDIHVLDLRLVTNKQKALAEKLERFKPEIVGISLMAFENQFITEHIDCFKEFAPEAKIVVGGPYVTSNYTEILKDNPVDVAVIGEGEKVFLNVVENYLSEKDPRDLKGIAYFDGEKVICNGREEYIEDLDSIPFPDFRDINLKDYWDHPIQMNSVLARKKYIHVMSSRACPYKCIYCHNIFGEKLRKRSPDNFVDEIKMLYNDFGVREFHIVDDVFNVDRKRMHIILNKIIDSKLDIKMAFPNAIRGDILSKEDILLLKKAGAYMITVAVETASERIQKIIGKNLDINKVKENIEFASKAGMITKGFFMLGFPGETEEELYNTIDFAVHSKLDMVKFYGVVPFQGTGLYDLAKSTYENFGEKIYTAYTSDSFYYEEVTGFNLKKLQKSAYIKFYSPQRLLKLFFKIPQKIYFVKNFISLSLGVLST